MLVFFVFLTFVFLLLLSPLGTIVAANLSVALLLIPWALKTFLGIGTVFSLSPQQMLNSTFFALVCVLSYLCLDPLVKAVYVLRCFYGGALQTGEDLKVELRHISTAQKLGLTLPVFLLCFLTIFSSYARAEEHKEIDTSHISSTAMSPEELDDSLRDVLSRPEYAWRMPREQENVERERNLTPFLLRILTTFKEWGKTLGRWFKKIGNWLESIGRWFQNLFPKKEPQEGSRGHQTAFDLGTKTQMLLYALLAVTGGVAALLLWRSLRNRKLESVEIEADNETPEPDLTEEEVDAGQLPPDEWLTLAQSLIERGDVRLALRALYLAGLACLAEHHLLTIAKYKSDRDYEKELQRRSHAFPALPALFLENMRIFQRSWYGLHEVSREMLEQVSGNYENLKNLIPASPETE